MNKRLVWVGYLLVLHIALVALVVHFNVVGRATIAMGLRKAPDPSGIAWLQEIHVGMDRQVPSGSAVFLGDSITFSLVTATVAPNGVNFGISGQRSDHLLASVHRYGSLRRAGSVYIMIGTNDVLQGLDQGLEHRYRAILGKVPFHVPVVLSSIPPISAKRDRSYEARQAAASACTADPRCIFVDAHGTLSRPGLLAEDGIHLSPAGYEAWSRAMREAKVPQSIPFSSSASK